MKRLILLASLLLSVRAFASVELKVGDLLLQPLDCWACSLIEAEEESIYSHIGIVVAAGPSILVAESYGSVKTVPYDVFARKTQKGQAIAVYRFQNSAIVQALSGERLLAYHTENFEGLKYDHDFRWNNFDESGYEKIYCSELVAKLLQGYLRIELPVKRMHFQKNRDAWNTYFRGQIPDNQWGISPADFTRSELFYEVGEL